MKKNALIGFIVLLMIVLVSCNTADERQENTEGNSVTTQAKKKNEETEDSTTVETTDNSSDNNSTKTKEEKAPHTKKLTDDEIYKIVVDNYNNTEKSIQVIVDEYAEKWGGADYIEEFDMEHEQTQLAYKIFSDALADYFTADQLKPEKHGIIHTYFISYFSWLIKLLPYYESVLEYGFNVVEQDEAHFIIESMELEDEAGYTVSGWSTVEFLKVDEKWKIHEYTTTLPEDRPFDLTYNDLNCVETDAEIEAETPCVFIDMTERDGESFIVYENLIYGEPESRNIIARNTANSELDFEIAESYR